MCSSTSPSRRPINEEAKSAASQVEVVFDQKNCIFEPHVLGVMNGAKVQVKNSDPVNHNVNSKLRNNGFNSLLAGGQTIARPIEAAERSAGRGDLRHPSLDEGLVDGPR